MADSLPVSVYSRAKSYSYLSANMALRMPEEDDIGPFLK